MFYENMENTNISLSSNKELITLRKHFENTLINLLSDHKHLRVTLSNNGLWKTLIESIWSSASPTLYLKVLRLPWIVYNSSVLSPLSDKNR